MGLDPKALAVCLARSPPRPVGTSVPMVGRHLGHQGRDLCGSTNSNQVPGSGWVFPKNPAHPQARLFRSILTLVLWSVARHPPGLVFQLHAPPGQRPPTAGATERLAPAACRTGGFISVHRQFGGDDDGPNSLQSTNESTTSQDLGTKFHESESKVVW